MSQPRFLILTALLPEAQTLATALSLPRVRELRYCWAGPQITLVNVGLRATRLASITPLLADTPSFQHIILAGISGALSPGLAVGDVLLDAGEASPPPAIAGVTQGKICTSTELIATPAAKAALRAKTACDAVDMEGDTVRAFLAARGLGLLHLRAISDSAEQALDPRFVHLVDDRGRPRIGRAVAFLLSHPGKMAELLRLQRATQLALSKLGAALRLIIAAY